MAEIHCVAAGLINCNILTLPGSNVLLGVLLFWRFSAFFLLFSKNRCTTQKNALSESLHFVVFRR